MADAGFKLSVEGEKEFRKAISDINTILRLNQAELQKVTAEYNAGEKGIDAMKAKQTELGSVIERQTDAVSQMEEELARLTDTYGENDKGTIKMRTELDKASASLASMQAQFRANAAEIEKASAAAESYDTTLEDADAQIAAFAAEIKAMDAAMSGNAETISLFGKNSEETKKKIADLTEQNKLLESSVEQHRKKLDVLNKEMEDAVNLYGSQSREVAEYRTKIAQTTTEVSNLTKKIEDNNETIQKAETGALNLKDVFSQIGDITGVQIPKSIEKMIGSVDAGAAAWGAMATAGAAVVKSAVGATTEFAMTADEIKKFSTQTGLSVEQVQELDYVAKQTNTTFEQFADMIADVKNNIYDAANGNEELAATFEKIGVETEGLGVDIHELAKDLKEMDSAELQKMLLETEARINGVSVEMLDAQGVLKKYGNDFEETVQQMLNAVISGTDVSGDVEKMLGQFAETMYGTGAASRDAYEVFLDVIDALKMTKSETDRAAIAEKLLGSSAKELTEIIALGEEGIRQYSQTAREAGLVFSEEVVDSMDQTAQAIKKVTAAFEGAKTSAKGLVAGLLTFDADVIGESWENLKASIGSLWSKSYATGTYNHPGGYALVGERGPEIVDLPAGSRVYPSGEYPAAGSTNIYNITIPASDIKEFNDIVRIAQSKRVTERMK